MKTFMLAATEDQAGEHARMAGLLPTEAIYVASSATLRGARMSEEDLVYEFPGFRQRFDAEPIIESVRLCIRHSGNAGPRWESHGS